MYHTVGTVNINYIRLIKNRTRDGVLTFREPSLELRLSIRLMDEVRNMGKRASVSNFGPLKLVLITVSACSTVFSLISLNETAALFT